jgi:hypothetical protein
MFVSIKRDDLLIILACTHDSRSLCVYFYNAPHISWVHSKIKSLFATHAFHRMCVKLNKSYNYKWFSLSFAFSVCSALFAQWMNNLQLYCILWTFILFIFHKQSRKNRQCTKNLLTFLFKSCRQCRYRCEWWVNTIVWFYY